MTSSSTSSRQSLIGDESIPTVMTDGVIDAYRDVKKYASAAFAGVRLLITERGMRKLEDEEVRVRCRNRRCQERFRHDQGDDDNSANDNEMTNRSSNNNNNNNNDYDYDNDTRYNFNNDEEHDDESSFEDEIQRIRRQKIHKALLSAHQMEAIWKITKIELDRIVRDSCRFVLCHYGNDYYLRRDHSSSPSSSSSSPHHPHLSQPPTSLQQHHYDRTQPFDGWVSTNGEVVQMHVGKLRAAAAMILMGDLFVQSSKENTSWNKH
jgi:hypothetical protein